MQRICTAGMIVIVVLGLAGMAGMALNGSRLEVASPWINVTPKSADGHHGYFVVTNRGAASRRLIAIESPFYADAAVRAGLIGGRAPFDLTPGGRLEFQPGGPFARLAHPVRSSPNGASVPLVLIFDKGERVSFRAPLRTIVTSNGVIDMPAVKQPSGRAL